MAKHKHGSGRGRQPHRRHLRPVHTRAPHRDPVEDQPLFQGLRAGLRGRHPLDMLSAVSALLEATDPRSRGPFDAPEPEPGLPELVESFVGTPYAETTAALTVIREMVADEVLAARIGRELATRRHPLPEWLSRVGDIRVEPDVWFLTHVLGDGDDYLLGAALPSGERLSLLVYVDHNMGTVVKDAFAIAEPLEDVLAVLGEKLEPEQSLTRTDPRTARAVIEEAVDHGARVWPPLESETWPMCRPLARWLVGMLPAGGSVPEAVRWSDEEVRELAEDFQASPYGSGFTGSRTTSLLDDLLWFGRDHGPGDPMRWSPVNVELLLADWVPRKVVASPAHLAPLPDLLRAFIRYCHARRGLRAELTRQTLDAVDFWEPEYQRLIRSSRPQGAQALVERLLGADLGDGDDLDDEVDVGDDEDLSVPEILLATLARTVGGRVRLQALDDAPLPDEPFEWAGVPEDVRPAVQAVLERCDRVADEHLDVEHRTAMRRFLGRAAVGDPAIFRRKASPDRGAAAIGWVICRANDTVTPYGPERPVQELIGWFGVTGSVSQRAETLLRANGVDPHRLYGTMHLGTPDLLTSACRRKILQLRDAWLAEG